MRLVPVHTVTFGGIVGNVLPVHDSINRMLDRTRQVPVGCLAEKPIEQDGSHRSGCCLDGPN